MSEDTVVEEVEDQVEEVEEEKKKGFKQLMETFESEIGRAHV